MVIKGEYQVMKTGVGFAITMGDLAVYCDGNISELLGR